MRYSNNCRTLNQCSRLVFSCSYSCRHAEKLRVALNELTELKDKEREKAVQQIQADMQSLVDTAYSARDEYLALYTKV